MVDDTRFKVKECDLVVNLLNENIWKINGCSLMKDGVESPNRYEDSTRFE